jgi:hypothetical protein
LGIGSAANQTLKSSQLGNLPLQREHRRRRNRIPVECISIKSQPKHCIKDHGNKLILSVEVQFPKAIKRADVIPPDGFALVVDGIFKNEFESNVVAQKAAREWLNKYPTLRVEIYEASTKARTLVCSAQRKGGWHGTPWVG